ncbi:MULTISPECIES: serine hydrolase [unclassified Streptomyces]|uniref:serine hydrolase domain-containing protein n=1 Tax=unclassified Streptomyces TaxID=2593676 RepID=UPI0025B25E71|nr:MULTISPECIES: serine hydrolase domain-containing protein [unclassified Streptomyces]MDN3060285.1 serine hydrolase [Streptomyces sp. SRF1]
MTFKHPFSNAGTTTTAGRRRRVPMAALACAVLGAVALGTAGPAVAVPAVRPAAAVDCTGNTTRNTTSDRLPELDPQALQQALSSAPDRVTGVLARVSGPDGHWTGTYGAADVTTGAPVPVDGRFRLGSVTKTFIATVMLQLAAEHRVDLDQPVQHYLPDVLPDSYPPIPVRTLLNFTSGLPELTQDDLPTTPDGIVAHRFDDHPLAELVAKAVRHERPFTEPGSMQVYGATGYYVAAMLVEHLTGHTYQQEITTRILQPLHLRDTTAPRTDTTIPGPHSHGYIAVPRPDGGSQLVDITEQNPGAGGMISTTADLDRFLTALFRGQLLPPTEQAELFDVPDVPYLGGTAHDPGQGRAYYAVSLMRVTLPNGVTVWGKTGTTFGYTNGMFTTRDLRRRLGYSFNPTTGGGNDLALVTRILSSTFAP